MGNRSCLYRHWVIALVNRHPSENVECTVKLGHRLLDGKYRATLLSANSVDSYNDIDYPDRVAPKEVELTFKKGIVDLPPHSLTIVYVGVRVTFLEDGSFRRYPEPA